MSRASAVAFAVGALSALTLSAAPPLVLRSDGIRFPDGTLQTTAASSDPRRDFYVTERYIAGGSQALTACSAGFHTASLWEILDVSNLRYASERPEAHKAADSGSGPPSNWFGWVRTGGASNGGTVAGIANCNNWAPIDQFSLGTVAGLANRWDGTSAPAVSWLGPWRTTVWFCIDGAPVWCIAN